MIGIEFECVKMGILFILWKKIQIFLLGSNFIAESVFISNWILYKYILYSFCKRSEKHLRCIFLYTRRHLNFSRCRNLNRMTTFKVQWRYWQDRWSIIAQFLIMLIVFRVLTQVYTYSRKKYKLLASKP